MKDINWWECPKCGWEPPDLMEHLYYVENGQIYILENGWIQDPNDERSLIKNEQIIGLLEQVKKVLVYPKTHSGYSDYWTGGQGWTEVHKCPHCNEEFEYNNANF